MSNWIITATILDAEASRIHTLANLENLEEAEAIVELKNVLNSYDRGVTKVTRREIFKIVDRSYLLRLTGRITQCEYLIQLGELVADTKSAALPSSL